MIKANGYIETKKTVVINGKIYKVYTLWITSII